MSGMIQCRQSYCLRCSIRNKLYVVSIALCQNYLASLPFKEKQTKLCFLRQNLKIYFQHLGVGLYLIIRKDLLIMIIIMKMNKYVAYGQQL